MGGGLGPLRMIAARLGLTDAQKSQIKTIMQSHGEEWKDLAARAATARKALHDAVTADAIDDNAIRQASAGVAAVEADAAVARARTSRGLPGAHAGAAGAGQADAGADATAIRAAPRSAAGASQQVNRRELASW